MSYEGYTQFLCIKGHYWTRDAYESLICKPCPYCKSDPIWRNQVDLTNCCTTPCVHNLTRVEKEKQCGCGKGIGYITLTLKEPEKSQTCPTCGHISIIEPETYYVPENGGHRLTKKDKDVF